MTTFRAINDTEIAVDAPLTQQLMQALRDNLLAIQEGDATAPQIAVPNATVGNKIVAVTRVHMRSAGETQKNFIGIPIGIRRTGTYRVFMNHCNRGDRFTITSTDNVSLNVSKKSSVPSTSDWAIAYGGVGAVANHVGGDADRPVNTSGENQFGATDILKVAEFDTDEVDAQVVNDSVSLSAGDIIYLSGVVDGEDGSEGILDVIAGLAIAEEYPTFTGCAIDYSSSMTWQNTLRMVYEQNFKDILNNDKDGLSVYYYG